MVYKAKRFLEPFENEYFATGEETLGTIIDWVDHSYDPVFVLDEKGKFKGLVSPYRSLFNNRKTYQTKVHTVLINIPKVTKDTTLLEIAKFMISSGVWELPVLDDNEKIIGVIKVQNLFQKLISDKDVLEVIAETVNYTEPVEVYKDLLVKDVYHKMRHKSIDHILVVDEKRVLTGILSRSDIWNVLLKPTPKQRFNPGGRFKQTGTGITSFSFDAEKKYREDAAIDALMERNVFTTSADLPYIEIIKQFINSDKDYLLIINETSQALGILTYDNLLNAICKMVENITIPINFQRPSKTVSDGLLLEANRAINHFLDKMQKRIGIEKVEVHVEEPKYTTEKTAVYNTSIILTPQSGGQYVAYAKAKDFLRSMHQAIKLIEKQQERDHRMYSNHENLSMAEATAYAQDVRRKDDE